eukprot:scaffold2848_cov352-Pavlova_lutheri.AAC.37
MGSLSKWIPNPPPHGGGTTAKERRNSLEGDEGDGGGERRNSPEGDEGDGGGRGECAITKTTTGTAWCVARDKWSDQVNNTRAARCRKMSPPPPLRKLTFRQPPAAR